MWPPLGPYVDQYVKQQWREVKGRLTVLYIYYNADVKMSAPWTNISISPSLDFK